MIISNLLRDMSIEKKLDEWLNEANPKFEKHYLMLSENIIKGEMIFLLSIKAKIKFGDRLKEIEISKYFLTKSGNDSKYLTSDVSNLTKLIGWMEQEFLIQEDKFIREWII